MVSLASRSARTAATPPVCAAAASSAAIPGMTASTCSAAILESASLIASAFDREMNSDIRSPLSGGSNSAAAASMRSASEWPNSMAFARRPYRLFTFQSIDIAIFPAQVGDSRIAWFLIQAAGRVGGRRRWSELWRWICGSAQWRGRKVALPPSVAPSNAFKAILAGALFAPIARKDSLASPFAMRMTWTALPITSAERFL
jgi:hypothetical protein